MLVLHCQRRINFLILHVRVSHALVFFVKLVLANNSLHENHALKLLLLDDALIALALSVLVFVPDAILELLVLENARIEVTHV